ncbi:MAG: DUF169 domain-containing protein [Thermodesulfobacteriota bacterium]|nr:DUF169 domain-containing protein [Thermodesulfobacteriota bacterium]
MDYQKSFDVIMETIMPQSFPLGLKIIKEGDPVPEKAVRPAKFGLKIAMCQWPAIARRWGWVTAAMAEDINCVPCLTGFGFKKLQDKADLARFLMDMGYTEDQKLASTMADQIKILPPGEVKGVVTFPLNKAPLDPDLVLIYGTPAQMTRLALGYISSYGRQPNAVTGFGLSCLSVVMPFWDKEPCFVNPGRGERMLGGTDDAETLFSLPVNYLEGLVAGLERTQQKGLRFPIQGFTLFQPAVIPQMKALEDKMLEV